MDLFGDVELMAEIGSATVTIDENGQPHVTVTFTNWAESGTGRAVVILAGNFKYTDGTLEASDDTKYRGSTTNYNPGVDNDFVSVERAAEGMLPPASCFMLLQKRRGRNDNLFHRR